jgi:hypothetical protein
VRTSISFAVLAAATVLVSGPALATTVAQPAGHCAATAPEDHKLCVPRHSVNTYILLDRTGSMQDMWAEALGSVNAYAEDLGHTPDAAKTPVTLAVFDAQDGLQFDVLRDHALASDWKDVTNAEASPRGMTPLYDAIGRLVSVAEKDNPKKAVIVIMTDGEENSSREVTQAGAKAALDRARARGWEVVFLGAEFARFSDAKGVGVSSEQTMAVGKTGMKSTMQRLAKKSADYYNATAAAPAPVQFNDEDRKAAGEDEVKQKQGQK